MTLDSLTDFASIVLRVDSKPMYLWSKPRINIQALEIKSWVKWISDVIETLNIVVERIIIRKEIYIHGGTLIISIEGIYPYCIVYNECAGVYVCVCAVCFSPDISAYIRCIHICQCILHTINIHKHAGTYSRVKHTLKVFIFTCVQRWNYERDK